MSVSYSRRKTAAASPTSSTIPPTAAASLRRCPDVTAFLRVWPACWSMFLSEKFPLLASTNSISWDSLTS